MAIITNQNFNGLSTYLSTNWFLCGVIHDRWRADREVSDILVLLCVAHVDFTPLALPEVAHSTWPDSRLNDDDAVLFGTVEWVAHRVCDLITVGSKDPGWVGTFARLVHGDGLQARLVRVGSEDAADFSFAVLDLLVKAVACFVVAEDALCVVHPSVFLAHLCGCWSRDGLLWVLRLVGLNVEGQLALFFTLSDPVSTDWDKLCGVMDSGDLRAQIVLFLTEIEWVGDDLSIEITCEAHLDLSGSFKVTRLDIWEHGPGSLCPIRHKVRVLVDSSATWLTALRSSILWQVLRLEDFNNIVIALSSGDLTPETERACIGLLGELLNRLLQNQRAILTKLNACLVEHMLIQ